MNEIYIYIYIYIYVFLYIYIYITVEIPKLYLLSLMGCSSQQWAKHPSVEDPQRRGR